MDNTLGFKNMKILLAEDSELNQQLVVRMLQKMGHDCDAVGDGKAVLDALQEQCYDVVLMDGQMPVMDGYEATRHIRKREQADEKAHIPIIALTGSGAQEDIDECLAVGMNDHLSKPISFKLLEEKLQQCDGTALETKIGEQTKNSSLVMPVAETHAAQRGENWNMRDEIIRDIVSGLNLPPAIAQKLLNEFIKTLPSDVMQLGKAIDDGDFPSAAKMTHSIKGASGNLRVNRIFQLASELEQVLKGAQDGAAKEEPVALFQELSGLVKQLI